MRPLAEKHQIRETPPCAKALNLSSIGFEPWVDFFGKAIQRVYPFRFSAERGSQFLEGHQHGSERARHDRALFVRPGKLERVSAEFLQRAFGAARQTQRQNRW